MALGREGMSKNGNLKRKEKWVMLSLHMFVEKTCFTNFLERALNFSYHIFGILNSVSNLCTSETIFCYFLVIFKSVVQIGNPLRVSRFCWETLLILFMIMNIVELMTSKAVMKKLKLSLKLISQNQSVKTTTDQSKLASYIDSSSEEEDLHVEVNFDEPIDLAIN